MRSVVLCAAAALLVTGCSSTSDKAARIADEGSKAFAVKGLRVSGSDTRVDVTSTQVLRDANGTAAVVTLQNRSRVALQAVPIALDVADRAGASIWRNDTAGLDTSLISVPVLVPGARTVWVNDQILPVAGTAAKVTARIGKARPAPGPLPRLTLGAPRLEGDPVDGVAARGELTNSSTVEQKDLVVYGVASRGGKVVAAGRAIVPRVAAGAKARYAIFFIGDPRGATLKVSAPPTVLEDPR